MMRNNGRKNEILWIRVKIPDVDDEPVILECILS
jgi:hypothetical protein